MRNSIRKISLILVIIVILPSLFFSIYEISNLNENEKMVEEIYNNQLEAILFSVNQYNQNIFDNWVNEIRAKFSYYKPGEIFQNMPGVNAFYYTNKSQYQFIDFYLKQNQTNSISQLNEIAANENEKLLKLFKYYIGGYRRIEPIKAKDNQNKLFLFFVFENKNNNPILGALEINSKEFVQYVLSPRIQTITEDKFIIAVNDLAKNEFVYVSENDTSINSKAFIKKPLWLLPDYEAAIQLKGETITNIIKENAYG